MNKRNLGNNGTKVFPIGLGGMSFSDAYGETTTIKLMKYYQQL